MFFGSYQIILRLLTHTWIHGFWSLVVPYGMAWVGHFFFEKNIPATFTYPSFSLLGDFKMWFELLTQTRKF
jgi:hypothetical protein